MNYIREEDIKNIIEEMPDKICDNCTFLITGANGFLASYMVDTLMYMKKTVRIRNCSVIALCRNKEKAETAFREWIGDNGFKIIINSVEKKIEIDEKIDYIIHAAGNSATRSHRSDPVGLIEANAIGTYNLLELAKSKNVKSFLFFSSGAVYGETEECELRENKIYNLDYSNIRNAYGCSKRMGEAISIYFWKQYNVPIKIVRISHTYGNGIDIDDGHVYSDFTKSIILNKNLEIKGTGKDARPFCYISDAIIAFWLILLKGENGETYNMANAKENWTIEELANILVDFVFKDRNLKVMYSDKSHDIKVNKKNVNTDKLESLGWNPSVSVKEGFKRLVESLENDNEVGK